LSSFVGALQRCRHAAARVRDDSWCLRVSCSQLDRIGQNAGVRLACFNRNSAGEVVFLLIYAKSNRDSISRKR
jgi:hypothetical protein